MPEPLRYQVRAKLFNPFRGDLIQRNGAQLRQDMREAVLVRIARALPYSRGDGWWYSWRVWNLAPSEPQPQAARILRYCTCRHEPGLEFRRSRRSPERQSLCTRRRGDLQGRREPK